MLNVGGWSALLPGCFILGKGTFSDLVRAWLELRDRLDPVMKYISRVHVRRHQITSGLLLLLGTKNNEYCHDL